MYREMLITGHEGNPNYAWEKKRNPYLAASAKRKVMMTDRGKGKKKEDGCPTQK